MIGQWRDLLQSYLALRRSLGYELTKIEWLVSQFIDWYAQNRAGQAYFTVADAAEWACLPGRKPTWHADRLGCVRSWATYAHTHDPAIPLIPAGLMPRGVDRREPYIYTEEETTALMGVFDQTAGTGRTRTERWKATTHQVMTGLLVCTGMRVGEAIALNVTDLDLADRSVRIVSEKSGRERLAFLHSTAAEHISAYLDHPDRPDTAPALGEQPVFVSTVGTSVSYREFLRGFRRAADRAGITAKGAAKPRIHDLRFTFAVNQITAAYREGTDPQRRFTLLSTWLGHVAPENTYWYMEAAPDLLAQAAETLERHTAAVRV